MIGKGLGNVYSSYTSVFNWKTERKRFLENENFEIVFHREIEKFKRRIQMKRVKLFLLLTATIFLTGAGYPKSRKIHAPRGIEKIRTFVDPNRILKIGGIPA